MKKQKPKKQTAVKRYVAKPKSAKPKAKSPKTEPKWAPDLERVHYAQPQRTGGDWQHKRRAVSA
jgi:hypothetical protein